MKTVLSLTGLTLLAMLLIFTSTGSAVMGAPQGSNNVAVCHIDGQGRQRQISVNQNAVRAHLAHGDTLGSCEDNSIQVVSATYGGTTTYVFASPTCPPPVGYNPEGNATADVSATCNGLTTCDYTVSAGTLGDPAFGCLKSFEATYQCGVNEKTVSVPGGGISTESDLHTVTLTCP